MKSRTIFAMLSLIAAIFTMSNSTAQPSGFDPAMFDPANIQKRIMEGYRTQLEITDDGEWGIIEKRIQKVLDARRAATPRPSGMGGMGGLGGMARMFGGGSAGASPREATAPREGADPGRSEQQQRMTSIINQFLPPASPEEDALRKALDAKAPKDEIKAALVKVNEARKAKQAALDKSCAELREVLTVQQEATATLNGLL